MMPSQDKSNTRTGFFQYLFRRSANSGSRLTRITVSLLFILVIGVFWPVSDLVERPYEINHTWQHSDLIADFTFPIYKPVSQLENEKEKVRAAVPEVFVEEDGLKMNNRSKITDYFQKLSGAAFRLRTERNELKIKEIESELLNFQPAVSREQIFKIINLYPDPAALTQTTLTVYDQIFDEGLLDHNIREIRTPLVSVRKTESRQVLKDKNIFFDKNKATDLINRQTAALPDLAAQLVREVLFLYAQPNYKRREDIYNETIDYALRKVLPYYGKVEKGEVIVSSGQLVNVETGRKIESYYKDIYGKEDLANDRKFHRLLAQCLLIAFLTLTLAFYLSTLRRPVYTDAKKYTFILFVMLISVMLLLAFEYLSRTSFTASRYTLIYLAPLCLGPLLLTIYFDDRIGFLSNVILSLLAAWMGRNNLEIFFVQFCAGTFGVLNMAEVRDRSQLFSTAGVVLILYIGSYLTFQFYSTGSFSEINYHNLLLFGVNALFILSIYPIVVLFGWLFGLTSELTYLELLNLEHPLLVDLSRRAPGTYQHSLQVAYISEELARTVKGNPIQAYVGALFHDIGKALHPEYFTENQTPGENPHDALTPLQSAEIIIAHITDGIEIARRNNLPAPIIAFIATHHGTTRVEYFYRQYVRQMGGEISEKEERLFRYPGPVPKTKEEAIVMIADTVEAAARSLEHPTHEDIKTLVENLINFKLKDEQFREANLTFEELTKIRNALIKLMQSIHHTRIKYPAPAEKAPL